MLHVFENVDGHCGPGKEVKPYVTRSDSGLPAAADDSDKKMFEVLSTYGTPIPVPEGLDVAATCTNDFLLSLLA